ncbi:MAG: 1,4-dihydroxy-2-naphthoate polyprenyltransferase [Nitriliruptoraceae bacterium]
MHWVIEAARPRTLPAAIAPVVVGTAAAYRPVVDTDWIRCVLALVVALGLQIAVNYANDLFDGVKGVDTPDRVGPRRAVAAGLASPRAMAAATIAAILASASAGVVLAVQVGWELLIVGALAIVAALGYSGGRRPYASKGLGEVSVFVFFGLVATVGSQYVQDAQIRPLAVVAAVPIGLLAVALLLVNNIRDIPTDAVASKRTLAVRLGDGRSRRVFQVLILSSVVWLAPISAATASLWPLLGLAAAPIGWRAVSIVGDGAAGKNLIAALEATARFQLLYALLLAIGVVL